MIRECSHLWTLSRDYLICLFKLFYLLGERDHQDTSLFHNRVERIFIDDHNVPTVR